MKSPKLFLILILIGFYSIEGKAKPQITWNPSNISQDVLIGTTSSISVNFTSDTNLTNVVFKVVPELAPFVSISPAGFSSVTAGESKTIVIIFSIPKGTPVQLLDGTVHLQSGGNGTVAKPLPVSIQTQLPTATTIPNTISLPSADRITTVPDSENLKFVNDEIDIFFKAGTPESAITAIVAQVGGIFLGSIPEENMYQVQVYQRSFQELSDIINFVRQDANVDLALHHCLYSNSRIPNDLGYQYSYGANLINLPGAWDITVGSKSFGIGIVDSVFDNGNSDLRNNITKPAINSAPVTIPHGTQVAGIIGAEGNNNNGIAGVMWNASLYLYSTSLPQNPESIDGLLTIRQVGNAIRDGVRVLNRSAGVSCAKITCTQEEVGALEESDALFIRFIESAKRQNKDILWVFSAGNGAGNHGPGVPVQRCSPARLSAFFSNVVSVSAVDSQKHLASFSNYGIDVTVAAPGVNILSTAPGDVLSESSGTSFSAPYVAGVAGLMLSVNPALSANQLKSIIQNTSDDTGNLDPEGNRIRLLNAYRAVQQAQAPQGQFLSFIEGNSGIPGDGIIINNTLTFNLNQPIPLSPVTDGLTFTVFAPQGVEIGQVDVLIYKVGDTNFSQCSTGIGIGKAQSVTYAGRVGGVFNLPQWQIETAFFFQNLFNPSCNMSLANSEVRSIRLHDPQFNWITSLDAAAVGQGQNNFIGTPIP